MHQEFFDVLHKDHEEVDEILSQIEIATNGSTREQHMKHLMEEIIPHMRGEEAAFYSALLKHEESKSDTQEGMKEHKEAEETLKTLRDMSTRSKEWMDTFHELREEIQHHVQEEESKIFDHARQLLSEDQMYTIMTSFESEKERMKNRVKA